MNKITPENLSKQKLSDIFLNVINDVDTCLANGIKLNMGIYWGSNPDIDVYNNYKGLLNSPVCVGCLGGMSVMGLMIPPIPTPNQVTEFVGKYPEVEAMKSMFDSFRCGSSLIGHYAGQIYYHQNAKEYRTFVLDFENVEKDYVFTQFYGAVSGPDLDNLKAEIIRFAEHLKQHNY